MKQVIDLLEYDTNKSDEIYTDSDAIVGDVTTLYRSPKGQLFTVQTSDALGVRPVWKLADTEEAAGWLNSVGAGGRAYKEIGVAIGEG